ncbi:hypothetical protein BaRGS_00014393, partial [Batillaria attramentaria]
QQYRRLSHAAKRFQIEKYRIRTRQEPDVIRWDLQTVGPEQARARLRLVTRMKQGSRADCAGAAWGYR